MKRRNGMSFFEAVNAMQKGKTVRRERLSATLRMEDGEFIGKEPNGLIQYVHLDAKHILANDWMIVEDA